MQRPERPHAVVVREVEKNVAEAGDVREYEKQSPARGQVRVIRLASAQSPHQRHEAHDDQRNKYQPKKRVRKSTMVSEGEDAPPYGSEDVEVRCFGGKRHRRGRKCGFAVEPSAAHAGTREKVRKWFQASSLTT